MPWLDFTGAPPPPHANNDTLRHVKHLVYQLARDRESILRHRRLADQPDDVLYMYGNVLPALVSAIEADDPEWIPDDAWLLGQRPPTSASSTGAVRWFVELTEFQKATFELSPDLRTGAVYDRMFKQNGSSSCFLDDLRAALMKGDPGWRGPYVDTTPPLPE